MKRGDDNRHDGDKQRQTGQFDFLLSSFAIFDLYGRHGLEMARNGFLWGGRKGDIEDRAV